MTFERLNMGVVMKIGVLSDTHLKKPTDQFKRLIELYFADVDKIFHLGDFTDWSVTEYLSSQKELVAVCGNMDPPRIRETLPAKRVIHLEGFAIGLIHGAGPPFGIEARIRDEFDAIDAIVYGHSHTPASHWVKKTFFFNPGSPIRSFMARGTLGILHLSERVRGEIITI
jgi:putative phosphoesterase